MTRQEFDARFRSTCDEFRARPDADQIEDMIYASVADIEIDDLYLEELVKSASDLLSALELSQ